MADSVSGSVPFGKMNASTKVYEIDPTLDPRWAALVNSDPRASVFHSPNWLRALQVYRLRARRRDHKSSE